MSDEIKDIPPLPKKLRQAIDEEKLAIFVGAGVSRSVGCDGWDELSKKLVKKCREENRIDYFIEEELLKQNDKIKLISMCHNMLNETDCFMSEMKKSLKDNEVDALNENDDKFKIYKDIKRLGNIFITTNADRYIDKFFNPNNICIQDFKSNDIKKHNLYKIHGCISNKCSLVFTTKKYIKRYVDEDFNKFIDAIFSEYTILFIGYGLGEIDLLRKIFMTTRNDLKEHFYLKAYFNHEQKIANFEEKYFSEIGVNLIPFSKNRKGYDQLKDIIDNWYIKAKEETNKMQTSFNEIDKALENPQ